jgi:TusA-related sulfurtransferase
LFFGTPAELKRLLPGQVVSIATSDPEALRPIASATSGVLQAAAIGEVLHVVVEDLELTIPRIRAAFERAGLPCGEIRPSAPSVEDVFVFMIARGQTEMHA